MSIFRKLNWFFKLEKKNYIIGILMLVVVAICQLIPPKVIGLVIDEIESRQISIASIFKWSFVLIVAAISQYIFRYIWRTKIWGGAAKLEKILRSRLFEHFMQMDQSFFQKYRTGDLMAHATNDLNAIQNVAGSGILSIADAIITGCSTIIAMILFVDWRLTLVAVLPLPLLAKVANKLGDMMHEEFKAYQKSFSDINDKAQESIAGIKVIKTFGQEEQDIEEFEKKIDISIKKEKRVFFLDALLDPAITMIIGISYILTIIVGGRLIMSNRISVGQLVSFISYIGMLIWPMYAIGQLFNILEKGNASYDRVLSILREQSQITEKNDNNEKLAKGSLSYQVSEFIYPGNSAQTLENISFHAKEGTTLGIVGKTGAGKTTIVKLILREFDNYLGEIKIGDMNIKDYSLDALLPSIGYVPQDHFLFSMTVMDNIRFANPYLSYEQIKEATEITAVHSDILGFPDGYNTLVGERGVTLSGGQKQRISIARAIILNPDLLILDDALSAVDAKTEESILERLKEMRKDKTTIICAHRLSSIQHADEIIVLEDGTITERGTHSELMMHDRWYKKMFEHQQLEDDSRKVNA